MLVALTHNTHYEYDRSIDLSPHIIRLRPAPHCSLPIKAYSMKVTPAKHFINWHQDPLGNHVANITFLESTAVLDINVDIVVETKSINPFDFFVDGDADHLPITYDKQQISDLQAYLNYSKSENLICWINENTPNTDNTLDFLVAINLALKDEIQYQVRLDPGVQTPEQTLALGVGSCRDVAWALCVILRHFGFATRFVSGYLMQLVDIKENKDILEDQLELHAWCEVFLPGAGWLGFDPTSGLLAADRHLPLCTNATPEAAAPISGLVTSCETTMSYHMHAKRLEIYDFETHSPLDKQQWQNVNKLGDWVDQRLLSNQIQLTIGGEPTYIDTQHLNDPQWQTEASGLDKLIKAKKVIFDLQRHFAKNGACLLTQGKWYPGEASPRWALSCCWRKDMEPIFLEPEHFQPKSIGTHKLSDAKSLIENISCQLGFDKKYINPLQEMQSQSTIGFALPIHWEHDENQWASCLWENNSLPIDLISGDSSIGYRLPLDKLSTNFSSCIAQLPDVSLFADQENLLLHHELLKQDKPSIVSEHFIKTALCVEIIDGIIHLFIPPILPQSGYLSLLAHIEQIVIKQDLVIQLTGYLPVFNNRLCHFSVTPDPGVLEVNIQPASSWQEMVNIHTILDEVVKKHHLGTEKYCLDGRAVSTGGGCHITLGGLTPSSSPFLKSPKLLQSMITFWQHHPSLSYLFSGLFIGPTCQAPRIDEARHDSLNELEIAFAQMPKGDVENYWLVDRLLRHLLVDVTGNTHRAEFCVDKLFSPDTEFGRQGLVELRAFEMQQHTQLTCLQSLLVRALVAAFSETNYHHPLIRWGNRLHDRFMLPQSIWSDFSDVIDYLAHYDFIFDKEWFKSIFEFKFPLIGTASMGGIHMEIRTALEPWPVLGEESTKGATSRSVDSSVERVQVKVTGLTEHKHVITCNGYKLPLHKTDVDGEYVAGVRFKSGRFSCCLHPNLPVTNRLVFDVVDQRLQRSIGGCQYFTQHPGGKNPTELPINAREAETRRRARFVAFGHTPGHIIKIPSIENPEDPYTLDLRKAKS